MVKGSTSEIGPDGAGDRAVRIPVTISRPPRRPRAANDNPVPLRRRVFRWLSLLVPVCAAAALAWMAVS